MMIKKVKRIIITGPESTGKSTLAKELATHYKTIYLPEYARTYVENLKKPYVYDDLVNIANAQIKLEKELIHKANNFLFVDTGLIITKIWFLEVYNTYPFWLDEAIKKSIPDLFLVCNYDLSWRVDPVRENGSDERRKYLMQRYISEIEAIKAKYFIISGSGKKRLNNAVEHINNIG